MAAHQLYGVCTVSGWPEWCNQICQLKTALGVRIHSDGVRAISDSRLFSRWRMSGR
jgi:hypothetical protein